MILILVADHCQQQAPGWILQVDGRSLITSFQQSFPTGNAEMSLQLRLTSVATEAVFFEDRLDLLFKERGLLGGRLLFLSMGFHGKALNQPEG